MTALSKERQYGALDSMSEGDTFDYGTPFAFAPDERVVWSCEEVVKLAKGRKRVTLHLYFCGVMLKSVIATLTAEGQEVQWLG